MTNRLADTIKFQPACAGWASVLLPKNVAFILIINLLVFQKLFTQAPADTFRLLQTLPLRAAFAATDNLANVYLITPDNAVEKYAPDGRRLARYSNNRLGQAARLDVSNPLKVLVWYVDFRVVEFLDRSLTTLGELNLIDAGYPEVRQIAAAADGNLWLYDEVNFRLVKITPEGQKRCESQSLNLLDPNFRQPSCLREHDDRVLLADSLRGIFVFDIFAQFDRLIVPLHPVKDFQVLDNQIYYLAGGKIVQERLQAGASRELAIPAALLKDKTAVLSGGKLILLSEKALDIYRY